MSKTGTLKAGRPSIASGKNQTLSNLTDKKDMKRVNFQLRSDLHTKLKVYAAANGKTITEILIEYVENLANE